MRLRLKRPVKPGIYGMRNGERAYVERVKTYKSAGLNRERKNASDVTMAEGVRLKGGGACMWATSGHYMMQAIFDDTHPLDLVRRIKKSPARSVRGRVRRAYA